MPKLSPEKRMSQIIDEIGLEKTTWMLHIFTQLEKQKQKRAAEQQNPISSSVQSVADLPRD